ncbi:MAG: glycosyltransferase family 2 protein [Oscillospiraceae bacterium]|jgi:glycosyltransferase involved in cell wall biosynthesis|nr:glycosyltransferase family 2 protein [Oscillospiraceae bacterium]
MSTCLYFVVPCYNEEEVFPETLRRLTAKLDALLADGRAGEGSRVLFVNDGSRDRTWELIEAASAADPRIQGLKLSRNCGHQRALLAGLHYAEKRCDCAISMDADLQDDIDAADQFLAAFEQGFEIVYGVRSSRRTDSVFKRGTAQGFYKFMTAMGADVVDNHADYRLMSRRALEALSEFREVNLFLRGVVPLIGFPSTSVLYERHERFAGESKYPLRKMIAFAFEGITSFSVKPLQIISWLGIAVSSLSVVALLYALITKILGVNVSGWTATVGSIWLLGGIQLITISVLGSYIGKIYQEVKARPRYFIEKIAGEDDPQT